MTIKVPQSMLDMSIGKKILSLQAIVLSLLAVVGLISYIEFTNINSEVSDITKKQAVEAEIVTRLIFNVSEKQKTIQRYSYSQNNNLVDGYKTLQRKSDDIVIDLRAVITQDSHRAMLSTFLKHEVEIDRLFLIDVVEEGKLVSNIGIDKETDILTEEALRLQMAVWAGIQESAKKVDDLVIEGEVSIGVIVLLSILIGVALSLMISKGITSAIDKAVDVANKISTNDFSSDIEVTSKDQTGLLLIAFKDMQKNLKERAEEDKRRAAEDRERMEEGSKLANESVRIKLALDSVSANVMMADENNNIIYTNDAVLTMLAEGESDIQKDLPNFSVNKLLGVNIDIFHKNPAHQQSMLASLKETFKAEIVVGGRTYLLIANPVSNDLGERLGSVVEWVDRTAELKAIKEEEKRVEKERAIAAENQRVRMSLDAATANVMIADGNNTIIYMNKALNNMMLNAESDIKKVLPNFSLSTLMGTNMDVFHKNPVHQKSMIKSLTKTFTTEIEVGTRTFSLVANPVHNDAGERLGTAVEWVDRTSELAIEKEVASIVGSAASGDLSRRIDVAGKEGFFKVVSEGINELTDISENVVKDSIRVLSALSEGNLNETIDTHYQGDFAKLSEATNSSISNLLNMVNEIRTSADSIQSSSGEIAQGNADLSQRTEQQASSLEETASSMEEMTSTVKQNADNARQANQLASTAKEQAEKGGSVVSNAVNAMSAINNSSKQIADIIGVIDEIAFQTNLLALNAAVEAARAGEQGRGFAVVAGEVRNLAQRSAGAAKEIKGLIKDSVEKVEEGSRLVDESGAMLEEIVTAVKKVSDIISEISAASDEQTAGIEEVNQAISSMDEMTQQNAALVEQAAAAGEAMNDQAKGMNDLMDFFDVGDSTDNLSVPNIKPVVTRTKPTVKVAAIKPAAKRTAHGGGGAASDEWEEF